MDKLLADPAFWMLLLFLAPLLLRVPVAVSLGGAALAVCVHWNLGYQMVSYNFFAGIAKFPLLAIPFFILAGVIMEKAGIAERIIDLIDELVGSATGGLALATVGVATFWGAVSGSGPATVAALGLILIPGMAAAGYDKPFATAVVSVASGLAIVIPPSIAFIVYGDIMQQSVGALFAAGVLPGIVVALFLMGAVYLISRRRNYRGKPRTSTAALWRAFVRSLWGSSLRSSSSADLRGDLHPHRGRLGGRLLRAFRGGLHLSDHHVPDALRDPERHVCSPPRWSCSW
jgi:C4-dicarboxylate transporter DctM subunit